MVLVQTLYIQDVLGDSETEVNENVNQQKDDNLIAAGSMKDERD
jgi:hypothetical protein